jgi:hypothetical protein
MESSDPPGLVEDVASVVFGDARVLLEARHCMLILFGWPLWLGIATSGVNFSLEC